MAKLAGWILTAIFGLFALIVIANNYILMFRQIRAKPGEKIPSMAPIASAMLIFLAFGSYRLAVFPKPVGWPDYLWLPLLLDPGNYLVDFLVMRLAGKSRSASP